MFSYIHTLSMILHSRSVGIFVASLVMASALPLVATQSMIAATQYSSYGTKDGTRVDVRRIVSPQDRLNYSNALQMYNTRLQNGEKGLQKPDINKRSTIDFYIKNPAVDRIEESLVTDPISTKDYVKPPEEKMADDAITVQERAELSRAAKTGKCWNFPGFSAGYMTLCKKFIEGKAVINTVGLTNDIHNAKVLQKAALWGSTSSKKNLFDGLKDNRSAPRTPYGKSGGRAADGSSSSRSNSSSSK